jgi:hypothetical protein
MKPQKTTVIVVKNDAKFPAYLGRMSMSEALHFVPFGFAYTYDTRESAEVDAKTFGGIVAEVTF